ncbi:hypothetical protein MPPM_4085 [Methylorubrum populi]|uniref:Uncharacterized protein n=1 Tax=Methylorubrum populi TaxID=223967 RepID=A0A160PLA9_9HYPH|nr:hypothetical protein MPPM_4085 [Methylorubrum populi]
MRELLQVEGQVVAGDVHRLGEDARGEAVRTGGDQGAHDPEPMLLAEGGEGGEGLPFVHRMTYISTIVET